MKVLGSTRLPVSAADLVRTLIMWYDVHRRALPWRAPPGVRPDPYRVWISEIMLQQTTATTVAPYFDAFVSRWPTVDALAAASLEDVLQAWRGLGYYARARHLHACARVIAQSLEGRWPQTEASLRALPGIGAYTAAAMAAIAFDQPATPVDGNVERVIARLFGVETPLPAARRDLVRLARSLAPNARAGDFAQAMMDLGATICTPRSPACGICPLIDLCAARRLGVAADLPRKAPKPAKPLRLGTVWIARRADGALLLERRPDRGLLGGTLAFPSSGWDGSDLPPPMDAPWVEAGTVTLTFTHFHLELRVLTAPAPQTPPLRGDYLGPDAFLPEMLTTLMRKAHDLVLRP